MRLYFVVTLLFLRVVDRINDVLGAIAMVFLVVMIGDMLYEVISRRVFSAPTLWAYDISYMLNGVGFLFAAGYTLRRNGHIRIDFLSTRFRRRDQDLINLAVYLFLVFPALICLVIGAYDGWLNAYLTGQLEPVSPWKPLLWPLYAGILIGFVSLDAPIGCGIHPPLAQPSEPGAFAARARLRRSSGTVPWVISPLPCSCSRSCSCWYLREYRSRSA